LLPDLASAREAGGWAAAQRRIADDRGGQAARGLIVLGATTYTPKTRRDPGSPRRASAGVLGRAAQSAGPGGAEGEFVARGGHRRAGRLRHNVLTGCPPRQDGPAGRTARHRRRGDGGLGPAGRGPSGWAAARSRRPAASVQPVTEHFRVSGGARLTGEVQVVGAKNSVLKLIAAALLAEGTTTLTTARRSWTAADGGRAAQLGCTVQRRWGTVAITAPAKLCEEATTGRFRGCGARCACWAAGGTLGRRAVVPLPGGTRSAPGH